MGNSALTCLVVMENLIDDGRFSSRFDPPTPSVTIPPPPLMSVVLVDVEEETDLVYLDILSVVTLGSWSHLSLLIRLTRKDTQCG